MWPFKRKATEQRSNFTDLSVSALQSIVTGEAAETAQIGAVQAAAGAWARAFAVASIEPVTLATRAITPALMYDLGRSLVLAGEAVWLLEPDTGQLAATRASDWDIFGVRSWVYPLSIAGPEGSVIRRVPAGGVLHPRINVDPAAPHKGQSPINLASATGRLAANLEASLRNETGSNQGYVIPAPVEGMEKDDVEELKGDIDKLKGRTALVPNMQRGWQDSGVVPGSANWKIARVGANPPEAIVNLRSRAARDVLAATGVPVELFSGEAEGTACREAWRVFYMAQYRVLRTWLHRSFQASWKHQ